MVIKQKSSSFLRNVALRTFEKLPIVFLTKVNLLYLLYSLALLSLASDKAKIVY